MFGRLRAALRGQRHDVMEALVRLSGSDGRCWVAMATLAEEARVNIKTARRHVHALAKAGRFLRADVMTWAQLCADRRAAGKRIPYTNNNRNAPYLFAILDGQGRPASELPEGERLHRLPPLWKTGRPQARTTRGGVVSEPKTSDLGAVEGSQLWESRGLPTLGVEYSDPPDQSLKESADAPTRTRAEQHASLSGSSTEDQSQAAWEAILDAYAVHYRRMYQASPTTPRRLKPEDPREAGKYLSEKAGVLAERIKVLELEAVRMLADRTLGIWLDRKGANDFLVRESHPLWALCQELPARANEAFKALVREHGAKVAPKTPEKPQETGASWAEIDAARRQAAQELSKIFGASLQPDFRPNVHPEPEKAVNVSRSKIRSDVERPVEKLVERLVERPVEKPVERTIVERLVEQPVEKLI